MYHKLLILNFQVFDTKRKNLLTEIPTVEHGEEEHALIWCITVVLSTIFCGSESGVVFSASSTTKQLLSRKQLFPTPSGIRSVTVAYSKYLWWGSTDGYIAVCTCIPNGSMEIIRKMEMGTQYPACCMQSIGDEVMGIKCFLLIKSGVDRLIFCDFRLRCIYFRITTHSTSFFKKTSYSYNVL